MACGGLALQPRQPAHAPALIPHLAAVVRRAGCLAGPPRTPAHVTARAACLGLPPPYRVAGWTARIGPACLMRGLHRRSGCRGCSAPLRLRRTAQGARPAAARPVLWAGSARAFSPPVALRPPLPGGACARRPMADKKSSKKIHSNFCQNFKKKKSTKKRKIGI